MSITCPYCCSPLVSQYIGNDGEALCTECARREIIALLHDLDGMEKKVLRRRVEDRLRKSPALMEEISTLLLTRGEINL